MNNKWELLKLLNEGMCDYFAPLVDDCGTHLVDHLLANGVTVQRWIPVTERLPEESDADDAMGVYAVHKRSLKRYWHFASVKDNPFDFTYWMPIPQPPEDGGTENV